MSSTWLKQNKKPIKNYRRNTNKGSSVKGSSLKILRSGFCVHNNWNGFTYRFFPDWAYYVSDVNTHDVFSWQTPITIFFNQIDTCSLVYTSQPGLSVVMDSARPRETNHYYTDDNDHDCRCGWYHYVQVNPFRYPRQIRINGRHILDRRGNSTFKKQMKKPLTFIHSFFLQIAQEYYGHDDD